MNRRKLLEGVLAQNPTLDRAEAERYVGYLEKALFSDDLESLLEIQLHFQTMAIYPVVPAAFLLGMRKLQVNYEGVPRKIVKKAKKWIEKWGFNEELASAENTN